MVLVQFPDGEYGDVEAHPHTTIGALRSIIDDEYRRRQRPSPSSSKFPPSSRRRWACSGLTCDGRSLDDGGDSATLADCGLGDLDSCVIAVGGIDECCDDDDAISVNFMMTTRRRRANSDGDGAVTFAERRMRIRCDARLCDVFSAYRKAEGMHPTEDGASFVVGEWGEIPPECDATVAELGVVDGDAIMVERRTDAPPPPLLLVLLPHFRRWWTGWTFRVCSSEEG